MGRKTQKQVAKSRPKTPPKLSGQTIGSPQKSNRKSKPDGRIRLARLPQTSSPRNPQPRMQKNHRSHKRTMPTDRRRTRHRTSHHSFPCNSNNNSKTTAKNNRRTENMRTNDELAGKTTMASSKRTLLNLRFNHYSPSDQSIENISSISREYTGSITHFRKPISSMYLT